MPSRKGEMKKCRKCGKPGHNRRTCGRQTELPQYATIALADSPDDAVLIQLIPPSKQEDDEFVSGMKKMNVSLNEVKPSLDEVKPSVDEVKPSVDEVKPSLDEVKPHLLPSSIPEELKKPIVPPQSDNNVQVPYNTPTHNIFTYLFTNIFTTSSHSVLWLEQKEEKKRL